MRGCWRHRRDETGRFVRWASGWSLALLSAACAPQPRSESQPAPSPDRFRHARLAGGSDGFLHVAAIEGGLGGGNRVFVVSSADQGRTWGSQARLHVPTRRVRRAVQIDAAGRGSVFVAWMEDARRLSFNRSLDGGRTWLPEATDLDPASTSLHPKELRLVSDGEHVHVVWLDDVEGFEAFYAVTSSDAGASWAPHPVRITPLSLGRKSAPQLSCDERGNVAVLWMELRDQRVGVYGIGSHDFGVHWDFQEQRLDELGSARGASLGAQSDGVLIAAWSEFERGRAILLARTSNNGGRDWGPIRRLAAADRAMGDPSPPQSYAARQHLGAAWEVFVNPSASQFVVAHSTDTGTRYDQIAIESAASAPLVPSVDLVETPRFAAAADASGNIYVVWNEATLGLGSMMCERLIAATGSGMRRGIRAPIAAVESHWSEPPRIHVDDFGHVAVLWNEGTRLVVATSAFFGDTGWMSMSF